MSGYYIYYTEASLVCLAIFGIMLARDLVGVDRQEKQIKFDHTLIAFMTYFFTDAMWAGVIAGILPRNRATFTFCTFVNTIVMAAITYTWLQFVMVYEQVPHRQRKINRFAVVFPFIVSTILLIAHYIWAPHKLYNGAYEVKPLYNAFLMTVPFIYIGAVVVYSLRRARHEENVIEKRRHLYIGFFPLMVVAGGIVQVALLPETPVFCFCSTILMLIFYIQSMEGQISVDPLTKLNNRGQLIRYLSQDANLHIGNRLTCVIMLDINDFKDINDTYGHAEGDRALVIIADALRQVVRNHNMPTFLGRYGGDEFVLIVHPEGEGELPPLVDEIRGQIASGCRAQGVPYTLSVGIGWDKYQGASDTFQMCLERADQKLYRDKARCKQRGL